MTYDEPKRRSFLSKLSKPDLIEQCIETEKLALNMREQNQGTIEIANRLVANFEKLALAYEKLATPQ